MHLTLVQAPKAELRGHPRFSAPGALRLDGLHPFPLPWGGARVLLAALRKIRGDTAVEAAVRPEAAVFGHCISGVGAPLDPQSAAPLLGFLTHHPVLRLPLQRAWQRAILPLLGSPAPEVHIPDPSFLDPESLNLLLALPLPALVIGDDPDWDERQELPIWRRDQDLSQGQLYVMGAMVEVEKIGGTGAVLAPLPPADLDPLDGAEEERAAASASVHQRLSAMRRAFAAFGFPAVIALSRDIDPSPLADADRAEWHLLVANAAYNRKVGAMGDQELADVLDGHFQAALRASPSPAWRSHLYYRLCINHGRRKGDLPLALLDAEQAIEAARTPGIDPDLAGVLEAWALNGRAFVYTRLERLEEARADAEAAWELLVSVECPPDMNPGEVRYGLTVLADNRAELALRTGDLDRAVELQEILTQRELLEEDKLIFAPLRSLGLARLQHRLADGITHARAGLESAQARLIPIAFDDYGMALAELTYRQGDAKEACRIYQACRPLRQKLASVEDMARWDASFALAALRAGELEEAEAALLRIPRESDTAEAEVQVHRSWIAALRGLGDEADRLANLAIAAAVQNGATTLLVRVARLCGEACAILARPEQALAAFDQALQLAADHPPTTDVVGALVGITELTGDPDAAAQAAALLPELLEDPEAWWLLPRLHRLLPGAEGLGDYMNQRIDLADS